MSELYDREDILREIDRMYPGDMILRSQLQAVLDNTEPSGRGKIKVQLDEGAYRPERAHEDDAGLDILSPVYVVLRPNHRRSIDSGVHVEIPRGYVGMLKSKSGLMAWNGVTSEGTIDAGYSGSIKVILFNHSDETVTIDKGQKISQLVILPITTPKVEVVNEVKGGERGSEGLGSTGK